MMNTVKRAAYRGLLGRSPEPAVNAGSVSPLFDEQIESWVESFLRDMSESEEFQNKRPLTRTRDYPSGTWILAQVGQNVRLWVDLGDLGVSRNCVLGSYEPVETSFLDSVLKPGMTFLDVGANVGWYSMRAAESVGRSGKVIAIEPRIITSRYLELSAKENGFSDQVFVHNVALGNRTGQMLIGWSSDGANTGGTWSLATNELVSAYSGANATTQSVAVVRLDDLAESERIDVIKIDIEGAEYLALSGGEAVIRRDMPVIMSEISPGAMQKVSLITPQEYVTYICSLGYRCNYLDMTGVVGEVADKVFIPDGIDVINVAFIPS